MSDLVPADFTIKRRDLLPILEATLLDANDEPVPIHDGVSSVRFYMRSPDDPTGTPKINGAVMDVIDDGTEELRGRCNYVWQAADTDTAEIYDAEIEVVFSNGKRQTFPNDRFAIIRVVRDIGQTV